MPPRSGVRALARVYDAFFAALGIVAALLIGAVALGITVDVVLRNLRFGTFSWMLESCEYAIFVATFLGAPWVLRIAAHVRVDVFIQNVPPGLSRALGVFADAVGAATSSVLLYYAITVARGSIRDEARIIKMFIIPEWWVFAVVAFSALLLVVEFVRRLAASLRGAQTGGSGLTL
jgi:TRAP-type C4-dicarboxylate transport system permease small subunit